MARATVISVLAAIALVSSVGRQAAAQTVTANASISGPQASGILVRAVIAGSGPELSRATRRLDCGIWIAACRSGPRHRGVHTAPAPRCSCTQGALHRALAAYAAANAKGSPINITVNTRFSGPAQDL